MKLPNAGSVPKIGRLSWSMRVSARNEPKTSTRSLTPYANVPAKSATFVYPCTQLVPRRYTLLDHWPLPRISAVGTYHSPVSPKNVVVAGRVSTAAAGDEGDVWVALVLCPVDVPEAPFCARAVAATASNNVHITATRLAIFCRLQSVCPIELLIPHDFPPTDRRP